MEKEVKETEFLIFRYFSSYANGGDPENGAKLQLGCDANYSQFSPEKGCSRHNPAKTCEQLNRKMLVCATIEALRTSQIEAKPCAWICQQRCQDGSH
jgi:hypothetical protein